MATTTVAVTLVWSKGEMVLGQTDTRYVTWPRGDDSAARWFNKSEGGWREAWAWFQLQGALAPAEKYDPPLAYDLRLYRTFPPPPPPDPSPGARPDTTGNTSTSPPPRGGGRGPYAGPFDLGVRMADTGLAVLIRHGSPVPFPTAPNQINEYAVRMSELIVEGFLEQSATRAGSDLAYDLGVIDAMRQGVISRLTEVITKAMD